jgi:Cu(I)/Ag(I) efflux system membrane fusion protein
MLAQPGGRYAPAEVTVGREADGRTEVLAGLAEGEKVVASGQFLLDSEASLSGVRARPIAAARAASPTASTPSLFEGVGRIELLKPDAVTISHQPIPAVPWPAMTMTFKLASPALVQGLKVGDRVTFAFDHPESTPTVRRIAPVATAP